MVTEGVQEVQSDCKNITSPFALLLHVGNVPLVVISELWFWFIPSSPYLK